MSTSTLTILFCHNTSAHDCIPNQSPKDCSGLKLHHQIQKVLRAYSRTNGIEAEIDSLELVKCNCSNPSRSSAALDGEQSVGSAGLRNGDRFFVRRRVEADEEMGVEVSDSDASASSDVEELLPRSNFGKRQTPASKAKADRIKTQVIQLLGGDAFLTTPISRHTFRPSMGIRFWTSLFTLARQSLESTPKSEQREQGELPKNLVRTFSKAIQERKAHQRDSSEKVITIADMERALVLSRQDSRKRASSRSVSSQSRIIKPINARPHSKDLGPRIERESKHQSSALSHPARVEEISDLWGNHAWKKERIEDDLLPFSLSNSNALKALWEMAQLTSGSYDGFPPLVLKALRQSLATRRRDPESYQKSLQGSISGWPQGPCARDALELIKTQVKGKGKQIEKPSNAVAGSSTPSLAQAGSFSSSPDLTSSVLHLSREAERMMQSRLFRSASRQEKAEVSQSFETIRSLLGL